MKRVMLLDSLKNRMILSLFLLTLIVTIVMNSLTFSQFNEVLSEQISEMSVSALQTVQAVYDKQISSYQALAGSVISNPLSRSLFLTSGDSDPLIKMKLKQYLAPLLSMNPVVDSFLLFKNGRIVYQIDSRVPRAEFKANMLTQIAATTSDREVLYVSDNGMDKIVVFSSDRQRLYSFSDYGVALVLNSRYLCGAIFADGISPQNTIIYDQSGNILVSQLQSDAETNQLLVQQALKSGVPSASELIGSADARQVLSYISSPKGGYGVLSTVDYQKSREKLTKMQNTMLLITLLAPLSAFFAIYLLVNFFYRPINAVLLKIRTQLDRSTAPAPSRNEFKQIGQIIDTTVTHLESLRAKQTGNEMIRYLKGLNQQTPERISAVEERVRAGYHYRLLLLLDNEAFTEPELLLDCLKKLPHTPEYEILGQNSSELLLILYAEAGVAEKLLSRKRLNDFACSLAGRLGEASIALSYGLTSIRFTCQELCQAYQMAFRLAKNSILYDTNNIFFEESIARHGGASQLTPRLVNELTEIVREDRSEQISEFVDYVFQEIAFMDLDFDEASKIFASMLTTSTLSYRSAYDDSKNRSHYLDCFLKVDACRNRREITQLLCGAIQSACAEAGIISSSALQDNILAALEYIDSHFGDCDLSLEPMAEKYKMSPSYFSKLISKYTGKTFPEYINEIRLKNGVSLLRNSSQMTVGEIAKQTGFASSSYFASAFKKRYGVTPSKYRARDEYLN